MIKIGNIIYGEANDAETITTTDVLEDNSIVTSYDRSLFKKRSNYKDGIMLLTSDGVIDMLPISDGFLRTDVNGKLILAEYE